ncbi:MAG: hypothetical protein ACTH5W_20080 [Providencia sp.]|uniref:hypothetical protein n=1 Tax=Providencia sp. TaxID=589 RepID=UPI003F96793C
MTKIIYLEKGRNSRARRRIRRGEFFANKALEQIRECERKGLCGPPPPFIGPLIYQTISELKLQKKLSLPKQEREKTQITPKDDIMNRVVNHAHQRSPSKKW